MDAQKEGVILDAAKAAMYANDFVKALEQLAPLTLKEPPNSEALYMSAVCARYRQDFDKAHSHLERLMALLPEFGRAHQEAGHLALAEDKPEYALNHFQRACRFNPALVASWQKQADLLLRLGNPDGAAQARAQVERLNSLPKPLIAVTNFLAEGKLLKAEDICRKFLKTHPEHVEGMRLLADIGSRLGVLEDADVLLENAVRLEPDNIQLRLDYIQILRKRQKFELALKEAKALYHRDANNPVFQSHYAVELMQTGDYDEALKLFDDILRTLPEDASTHTSRGHALKTNGQQGDAIKAYKSACTFRPEQGDAWYALANLKTYKFTLQELELMRELEAGHALSHADRVHFCFALGKAFEDKKDYAQAFGYYEKGNALKRAQSRYVSETMENEFSAQKSSCTQELFKSKADAGHDAPDPIFIVGLPRAGSTLIEQILASHSQVDGTLELPNILSLAQRLRGRNRMRGGAYPECLHDMSADQFEALGREYIDTTRIHRQGAAFFTDKMPNNFRHIALMQLILPNAKIIDARREPMACCFSGFKQLFAEGQEFTYGLEEIGRYYRAYVDLMAHWDEVLPGKVLRVQHEDVVENLEDEVRRILEHCGLPFEEACVSFHQTKRAVRTASSEQVREPINTKGLDVWRDFEPYLKPLKMALGPDLAP